MLTCAHDDGLRVSVTRHDTISMIDVDLVAIAAGIPAGVCHHAVGCRYDRRAEVVGDVNARVEVRTIPTQTKGRTDLAARRPDGRNRDGDAGQGIGRIAIGEKRGHFLLLRLQNLLELLQAGTANSHAFLDIFKRRIDIFRLQLCNWSALPILCPCCSIRSICRRSRRIGRCNCPRHAAQVVFHLRQFIQFLLQAIRFLGKLQKLLLLHIADLTHLFQFGVITLDEKCRIERIGKRHTGNQ